MRIKKPKNVYAKKSFGQNFLIDQNYIEKIIFSLNPQKNETIIEIGAGRGALTERLVKEAEKVIAIELDKDLIPALHERFQKYDNFLLVQNDALEIDFRSLLILQSPPNKTKLVANLPYYISTAILQHLIQYRHSFSEMVLMLQREVVERITAEAGNKERGFLTVLVQTYFEVEKLFDVSPKAFRPVPKVWSSVLRLKPKRELSIEDEDFYREMISLSFQHKRKTIQNNLKNAKRGLEDNIENIGGLENVFEAVEIKSNRRAESLTLTEWKRLYDILK